MRVVAEVSLPKFIVEELKERAGRAGVAVEEYLFDILVGDIDSVEGAGKYVRGAEELVEQVR